MSDIDNFEGKEIGDENSNYENEVIIKWVKENIEDILRQKYELVLKNKTKELDVYVEEFCFDKKIHNLIINNCEEYIKKLNKNYAKFLLDKNFGIIPVGLSNSLEEDKKHILKNYIIDFPFVSRFEGVFLKNEEYKNILGVSIKKIINNYSLLERLTKIDDIFVDVKIELNKYYNLEKLLEINNKENILNLNLYLMKKLLELSQYNKYHINFSLDALKKTNVDDLKEYVLNLLKNLTEKNDKLYKVYNLDQGKNDRVEIQSKKDLETIHKLVSDNIDSFNGDEIYEFMKELIKCKKLYNFQSDVTFDKEDYFKIYYQKIKGFYSINVFEKLFKQFSFMAEEDDKLFPNENISLFTYYKEYDQIDKYNSALLDNVVEIKKREKENIYECEIHMPIVFKKLHYKDINYYNGENIITNCKDNSSVIKIVTDFSLDINQNQLVEQIHDLMKEIRNVEETGMSGKLEQEVIENLEKNLIRKWKLELEIKNDNTIIRNKKKI